MVLKAKFEVEVEEHFDNEADNEFIKDFKATPNEAVTERLKKAMEDTLTDAATENEKIKVTVADWDTDFEI